MKVLKTAELLSNIKPKETGAVRVAKPADLAELRRNKAATEQSEADEQTAVLAEGEELPTSYDAVAVAYSIYDEAEGRSRAVRKDRDDAERLVEIFRDYKSRSMIHFTGLLNLAAMVKLDHLLCTRMKDMFGVAIPSTRHSDA